MTSLVVSLGGWSWIVAGLALLILEVLAPGAFMMWLGLAALAVGIISLMIDWSWQAQFVVFALLSVAYDRWLAAEAGTLREQLAEARAQLAGAIRMFPANTSVGS